jgi:glycine reductase complex component B subunit gamma
MVKSMERLGLPAVHVCTIVPISQTVGANRILPGTSIPFPTGNPNMLTTDEFNLRKRMMVKAIEALGTSVTEQTVFSMSSTI